MVVAFVVAFVVSSVFATVIFRIVRKTGRHQRSSSMESKSMEAKLPDDMLREIAQRLPVGGPDARAMQQTCRALAATDAERVDTFVTGLSRILLECERLGDAFKKADVRVSVPLKPYQYKYETKFQYMHYGKRSSPDEGGGEGAAAAALGMFRRTVAQIIRDHPDDIANVALDVFFRCAVDVDYTFCERLIRRCIDVRSTKKIDATKTRPENRMLDLSVAMKAMPHEGSYVDVEVMKYTTLVLLGALPPRPPPRAAPLDPPKSIRK